MAQPGAQHIPTLGLEARDSAHPQRERRGDVYFSADVETDGPIPGPFSMLSMALVYAGRFDGNYFEPPTNFEQSFYRELRPISDQFQAQALAVNGLDRNLLLRDGADPVQAMTEAASWVKSIAAGAEPVLVAYPLSFDWSWLYWYFTQFATQGSPFNHSRCFDLKTAFAVKARVPVSLAGRSQLDAMLKPSGRHTHHALDDAREQAEIFVKLFDWKRPNGSHP